MSRPRLLDLFCGAGGAAVGYHRAGFEVFGIDHAPQPNYPYTFDQGDALEFLEVIAENIDRLPRLAAIHASPPCQAYSRMTRQSGDAAKHPRLIGRTRELLRATGLPYVIENVSDALPELVNPIRLCGSSFGLGARCFDGRWRYLERHRWFECSGFWPLVPPCQHLGQAIGVYGEGGRNWNSPTRKHPLIEGKRGAHGYMGDDAEREAAMEVDWMSRRELAEAIPPAYTEFLGGALLAEALEPRLT